MEPISDSEIKRVLVVNAHPDDSDFGASGTIAQWVQQGIQVSYVLCTNGDQGGEESGFTEVTSGVIQGSTLSPILAVMMLDSIDDDLEHSQASKYADNNKVYRSCTQFGQKKYVRSGLFTREVILPQEHQTGKE